MNTDDLIFAIRRGTLPREVMRELSYRWNEELEREALAAITRQIPNVEYGYIESVTRPVFYIRWQNGPDLYAFEAVGTRPQYKEHTRKGFTFNDQHHALFVALCAWTQIAKKQAGDAPRVPLNVDAVRANAMSVHDASGYHYKWSQLNHFTSFIFDEAAGEFFHWFQTRPEHVHDIFVDTQKREKRL